ncbi:sialate O-acetylesterase [Kiritimatiellota bacterium B12222]|nr:sialate O-acetylesterase [Kiritimatiellota bacterium B12222]
MKLSSLFSDHMVLQRERPAPIWGWADPGEQLTVCFAGQQKQAVAANESGRWEVHIDTGPACAEGRELLITSTKTGEILRCIDVVVGDVWLSSGQSNMEWQLQNSMNAESEISTAHHPNLRLFQVTKTAAGTPPSDVTGTWKPCSPASVETFSAVAYFFGRNLQQSTHIPIGLLNASWGGTRIETWMSREDLLADPHGAHEIEQYENPPRDPETLRNRDLFSSDPVAWLRAKIPADPGNTGKEKGWANPNFDDSAWSSFTAPSIWQKQGFPFNGVLWFRKRIEIPPAWKGKELNLHLGACDKHDTTYVNGTEVGRMGWEVENAWCTPRTYQVPGALVHSGEVVITTRVYSYMTDGGLIGPASSMFLQPADAPSEPVLSLAGEWRVQVEHELGVHDEPTRPLGPGNANTPHILYDNMIHPLAPFGLRGVIWYQGESNAEFPEAYARLFPSMIRSWRKLFDCDLPFYFVQLANYLAPQSQPSEGGWAWLRDAQTQTLHLPDTGMAVTLDIGDETDIHPRNKQEVGRRLALLARRRLYGESEVDSGPTFRSAEQVGNTLHISFDHAEGGLLCDNGKPDGFAIAGDDQKFVWAEAHIDDTTVVVSSPEIPKPVSVRYAWANNPVRANLRNQAGLPASPFRSDNWAR